MEAREYFDLLKDEKAIIRLSHFTQDECDGRGHAVIFDKEHQIAIMLEDCGTATETDVWTGDFVKFVIHPEAEPKIVGTPARFRR